VAAGNNEQGSEGAVAALAIGIAFAALRMVAATSNALPNPVIESDLFAFESESLLLRSGNVCDCMPPPLFSHREKIL
jgi:hypothetical protein